MKFLKYHGHYSSCYVENVESLKFAFLLKKKTNNNQPTKETNKREVSYVIIKSTKNVGNKQGAKLPQITSNSKFGPYSSSSLTLIPF